MLKSKRIGLLIVIYLVRVFDVIFVLACSLYLTEEKGTERHGEFVFSKIESSLLLCIDYQVDVQMSNLVDIKKYL